MAETKPPAKPKNPWKVLGLQDEWDNRIELPVTKSKIESTYRKLAVLAHPDKAPKGENEIWTERFHVLQAAKDACLEAEAKWRRTRTVDEDTSGNEGRHWYGPSDDGSAKAFKPVQVTHTEAERMDLFMGAARELKKKVLKRAKTANRKSSKGWHDILDDMFRSHKCHALDCEDSELIIAIRAGANTAVRRFLQVALPPCRMFERCPCGDPWCFQGRWVVSELALVAKLVESSQEEGLAALDGSTALHAAAKYDNKEAVAILKEFAREDWPMLLSHRNRAGQMAYELAPDRSSLFDVLYCGNR